MATTTAWSNRIVGYGDEDPKTLVANSKNWRKHPRRQRAALAGVLDEVGWVAPVIVNRRTGRVVDGHLRIELAVDRREHTIPVSYIDVDEAEEAKILATFDPIAALAAADEQALGALLQEVETADAAVAGLLAELAREHHVAEQDLGLLEPDEAPPVSPHVVSRHGDVWLLGEHRLLCGDATDHQAVEDLLAGERPTWMWTDPPYGVDYVGGTQDHLQIANDTAAGIGPLLADAFATADRVLADGAPIYVASPAGALSVTFGTVFLGSGWTLHQTLVWVKDSFVLGHSDYHYRHEPVLYGWKGTDHPWLGGRDQSSVFEVPRPRRSAEHPTMKPVALVEAHLRNSSARGALGYDPFCGSGTTLIAAERLQRRCAGVELDPGYVDVGVRRWQRFTGRAAVLRSDGRTFTEVERHGR